MNYDNYIINDGLKDITIYPLLEFENNNKRYLVYTDKVNNDINELYIAEMTNSNQLIPIDDNLIEEFEKIVSDSYETIKEKINKNN